MDYDHDRSRLVPTVYGPEMHRYEFWKPHATPIPASLLNLTGWLGQNPSRVLPVEREGETVGVPASQIRPEESVLFRLDRPGTKERADWEAYFGWVTTLQQHQWLVEQYQAKARAKLAPIDGQIADLQKEIAAEAGAAEQEKDALDQVVQKIRTGLETRAKARAAQLQKVPVPAGVFADPSCGVPTSGDVLVRLPLLPGAERHLPATTSEVQLVQDAMQKARAVAGKWDTHLRDLERKVERLRAERKPYELELDYLETQAISRVYAGLFAKINTFLHVQALSAATIAIEEYRTNPRHESAVAEEMRRQLAMD